MYRILITLLAVAGLSTAADAQQPLTMHSTTSHSRILVACFSATGTTARVAARLAAATGGTLYAITPAEPYTAADLDWHDRTSRSSVEMNDAASRPALGGERLDTDAYDVIFLGYPIWWDLAPRVVNTFLERHDLTGKRVIPFATSGGSGISNSVAALKRAYPDCEWEEGRLLNRSDDRTLGEWLGRLGL